MSERNCIDCQHFRYDTIQTETEDTYGSGGFDCAKNHYQDSTPFDATEVRKILWTAVECQDFEPLLTQEAARYRSSDIG
jgi:hypothetical protein